MACSDSAERLDDRFQQKAGGRFRVAIRKDEPAFGTRARSTPGEGLPQREAFSAAPRRSTELDGGRHNREDRNINRRLLIRPHRAEGKRPLARVSKQRVVRYYVRSDRAENCEPLTVSSSEEVFRQIPLNHGVLPCQRPTTCHPTTAGSNTLYLAFELGWTSWNLAFTTAMAQKPRLRTIPARDLDALQREILRAKQRFALPGDAPSSPATRPAATASGSIAISHTTPSRTSSSTPPASRSTAALAAPRAIGSTSPSS